MNQLTKEECIALLQKKYEELKEQGRSDYPKRADFSEKEVIVIKAYFGPWPRALEAAGISPSTKNCWKRKNKKRSPGREKRRSEKWKQKKDKKKMLPPFPKPQIPECRSFISFV